MEARGISESSLVDSFPYPSRLQTNYIPSEEEVVQIKAFLKEPSVKLKALEDKITRLEAELEAAEKDYLDFHSQYTACYSLVSLPRRLPDDVLREIFVQSSISAYGNAVLDKDSPPLVFTRICRHWRDVAFTTPEMWSTIHIPVIREEIDNRLFTKKSPMSEEQAYQQVLGHADMVLKWLQRSGVCPLYISVFGKENYNWYGRRGAIPVVLFDTYAEAILPFTKRWKSLSLTGMYSSFSSVASISKDDVPSLESLFLNLRREEHILPDVLLTLWTNSGLFRSPSLRQLCMRDLILDMTQLQVQWKGLTHLRLGSPFDDHHDHWSYSSLLASLSRVLKYCTSLICCQLYLPYLEEYDPADAISSMYLPSIKHLTFHESNDSLPFVEKLEIPNAKELDFRSSLEGVGETIVALLARTNGNLRKFAMQTEHVSDAHFIECLRQCPNVTVLSLKHIRDRPLPEFHIDDKLLNLLTRQDDTILCPLLEEFKCDFTTDFTFEGFVDFVKKKQSTLNGRVAKLKRVHIRAVMEFDPSTERQEYKLMRPEFQGYIDDGMLFKEHRYGYENASEPSECFTSTAGLTSEQYTMWDIQI